MLRSPGSARVARPMIPEEARLKAALLGVTITWQPELRAFTFSAANVNLGMMDGDNTEWDMVLGWISDRIARARLPAGHTSNLQKVERVVVEAASVIDVENFNG